MMVRGVFVAAVVMPLLAVSCAPVHPAKAPRLFMAGQPAVGLDVGAFVGAANVTPVTMSDSLRAQGALEGGADSQLIELSRASDKFGSTVRMAQTFGGVRVDGAEVVSFYDVDGNLQGVNASLASMERLAAEGARGGDVIDERAAAEAAIAYYNGSDSDVARLGAGELLLVAADATSSFAPVWRFTVAGVESRPALTARVDVAAAGSKAGTVNNAFEMAGMNVATTVSIYNASMVPVLPTPKTLGVRVLVNGQKTQKAKLFEMTGGTLVTKDVRALNGTLSKTLDYYRSTFGRESYDGKGAEVVALAEVSHMLDLLGMSQNAAWHPIWKFFMFGSGGDMLDGFAEAIDVAAHEFTHAVVTSSVDLGMAGQQGGLNEHVADVFGEIIEHHFDPAKRPFLIGDTVLRGELAKKAEALRDMLHPEKGLDPQPTTMAEIPAKFGPSCVPTNTNDSCGVHFLNGVPNRALAMTMNEIGHETIAPVVFRVMTARLRSNSDFADYAAQMKDECPNHLTASQCEVLVNSFAVVGL